MSYFLGVNQAHIVHREVAFHSSKDEHKVSDGYFHKGVCGELQMTKVAECGHPTWNVY